MVQFACETDFVAKTAQFSSGLEAIMSTVADIEALSVDREQSQDSAFIETFVKENKLKDSLDAEMAEQTIEEGIKHVISKTQENCQLARLYKTQFDSAKGQVCASYLHNKSADNIGKIGTVFVSLTHCDLTLLLSC